MKKIRKKGGGFQPPSLFRLNSTGAALSQRRDCPLWETISQSYAFVILTLFPLLLSSKRYVNITVTKFTVFAVLTCLYALLCLIVGLVFRPGKEGSGRKRERSRVRLSAPQLFLCAYVLWAVISTLASPYPRLFLGQSRYEGLFSLLLYASAFLLLSFWGEYTDLYIYGLAAMGASVGALALCQTFGSTLLYPSGGNYWSMHFLTTIGHEDCVAGYICILVPALLCGFVLLQSRLRWLCLPGLILLPYLMVYTDVDTAKLGFLVVVLLLPCLIQSRDRLQKLCVGLVPVLLGFSLGFTYHKDRSFTFGPAARAFLLAAAALGLAAWLMGRRQRVWSVKPAVVRRTAYLLLLALLIVAMIVLYGYQGDSRLAGEISSLLHGDLADEAGTYRGFIWKSTVKIIGERPLLGGGPGSFSSLFMPYNSAYRALSHEQLRIDFPHNDFLSVAACTGLVGLALYLAFLISLAVRGIRASARCGVLLIFLTGMAGYLVYAFFVFSIAIVSPLFWVMAGLAEKCVRQAESAV